MIPRPTRAVGLRRSVRQASPMGVRRGVILLKNSPVAGRAVAVAMFSSSRLTDANAGIEQAVNRIDQQIDQGVAHGDHQRDAQ